MQPSNVLQVSRNLNRRPYFGCASLVVGTGGRLSAHSQLVRARQRPSAAAHRPHRCYCDHDPGIATSRRHNPLSATKRGDATMSTPPVVNSQVLLEIAWLMPKSRRRSKVSGARVPSQQHGRTKCSKTRDLKHATVVASLGPILSRHDIFRRVRLGGFPEAVAAQSDRDRTDFSADYVRTISQRDTNNMVRRTCSLDALSGRERP
jgi:hypothetical protein